MSNQLRTPPRRAFVRAPGVIGHYPCFQAVAEGAFLTDRSGAGNGAAFGANLTAAAGWAAANRLTLADNNAGSQAGGPFLSQAVLNFNLATESFIISGIYNSTNTASSHPVFGFGEITGGAGAANGFVLRTEASTGNARLLVCYGAAGATALGTTAGVAASASAETTGGD